MRWRALALISLGVNVLLAAVWVLGMRSSRGPAVSGAGSNQEPATQWRTNQVLRRISFSWRDIESPDYATYIANLRQIGCPEQTVRDIIIADVNALYARKRAAELLTPDQQWWRSEPDPKVVLAAAEKLRGWEEERRALLSGLLGLTWESGDLANLPRPSRQGVTLDGAILGALPAETKQALQEINLRSQERVQAYLDAQRERGQTPSTSELARLRQQTREELARLLSPAQLEEYLLRYSQYASNLRTQFGQLQYFNPTADEFRAIFRATDAIDQRIQLLADAGDLNSVQSRKALEDQRETILKQTLGAKRYQEYRLLQDPLYRAAVASAQEAGTPEAVQTFYAINQAAATEQQSILSNSNLTTAQRDIQMKSLQLDQLRANTLASGQDLPPEPSTTPSAPTKRTYTLRPGDTAAVVGMIYGVPESAIRAANPNVNFSQLRPGDSIVIPRSALSPGRSPLVPSSP